MATRKGMVKKTDLMDYSRPRQGGIIGITLDEGDALIDVCLTQPGDEVVLSHPQRAWRSASARPNARAMGRNTRGVKGIKLGKDDEVVGMVVADPDGLPADRVRERLRQADAVRRRTRRARRRRRRPTTDDGDAEPEVASRAETENGDGEGDERPVERCATASSAAAARALKT